MTVVRAEPGRGRRLRRPPWVRLVRGFIVVAVVTGGAIAIVLWWEDRPLSAIEQALDRRDYALALELSDAYLKEFPRRSRAIEQKGRALAGLGHWAEAGRLFDQFGAESIPARRAWSQALLHARRWTEALPLLTILSAASPQDADLLHELSACQARLGYFQESSVCSTPGGTPRQRTPGRLLLRMLHYRRGNNRSAIEAGNPARSRSGAGLQVTAASCICRRALLSDGRPAGAVVQLKRAVDSILSRRLHALAEADEGLGNK